MTRLTSVTITSSWNVPLSTGFFSEALVLARVMAVGGIAISIHERSAPGEVNEDLKAYLKDMG